MDAKKSTLVSIVIPSYNNASFISEAIESVLAQTYRPIEVMVIDDGSTDNTREICARYPSVAYHYQPNQGVSVARNHGLEKSRGSLVLFLDSDDRLLPDAIATNVAYLQTHTDAGFVFGLSRPVAADGALIADPQEPVETANYQALLQANLGICPCGVVLFQRSVFEAIGQFNPALRLAQDYDLYLRVARAFPIYCHNQLIADYRQHAENASSQATRMLKAVLGIIDSQQDYIQAHPHYQEDSEIGKKNWSKFWGSVLAGKVGNEARAKRFVPAIRTMLLLVRYHPSAFLQYLGKLNRLMAVSLQVKNTKNKVLIFKSSVDYKLNGVESLNCFLTRHFEQDTLDIFNR
ncbi:glycosyltransferase [Phormidesmis sp. 146-35]